MCHGHNDFADILRLQVYLVHTLSVFDIKTDFPLFLFSSGIGFGCSSGNNAGKKGSIKFAEQVCNKSTIYDSQISSRCCITYNIAGGRG